MAHPAACCAVTTDVRKPLLVVSVRGTERHLLYRLVNDHALERKSTGLKRSLNTKQQPVENSKKFL